ncbi:MAG TPA: hypothetical protein VFX76_09215 [Roseiflexaceae bacterium]|nr:hypothetical protein [Roseiflexaceae bacterium]
MQLDAYHSFSVALRDKLAADPRVLGLVALGSMADQDYAPDQWSDHDFFVIVEPGQQERFRTELRWLPAHERIVLALRETDHGLKIVYDDGHLLEFAVFDLAELELALVNRYRVLFDRGEVAPLMAAIAAATTERSARSSDSDEKLLGQFLTNLLVGAGRHARGEQISGRTFVKTHALRHLLVLLERHLPSTDHGLLDNLEPTRRFERVYSLLGSELNAILEQPTPQSARELLALAERELRPYLPDYPARAAQAIADRL